MNSGHPSFPSTGKSPADVIPAGDQRLGVVRHLRISIIATLALALLVSGAYPLIVWGLAQMFFPHEANGSLLTDASGKVIGSKLLGQPFAAAAYFHPRPSLNNYDPTNTGGSNLGPTSAKLLYGTTQLTTPPTLGPAPAPSGSPTAQATTSISTEAVQYDGIALRVVHFCVENSIGLETSRPLADFHDKDGNLIDTKLIDAFNYVNTPLTVRARTPIPADAVTSSGSGMDPHISIDNANLQAARVGAARKADATEIKKLIRENIDGAWMGLLGDPGVNVVTLNIALDKNFPVPNLTIKR